MWNRKREDEPVYTPPSPQPPQPTNASLAREGIPIQPVSRVPDARASAAIGKSVLVKGQLYAREDIYVDGEVEGSIEMKEHRLTVGPNGKVTAGIKAREVVAYGTIHGNIEVADKIEIKKDAKIVGDIKTARIMIEDGAFFKGGIDIAKVEPPPPPVRQASAASASIQPSGGHDSAPQKSAASASN